MELPDFIQSKIRSSGFSENIALGVSEFKFRSGLTQRIKTQRTPQNHTRFNLWLTKDEYFQARDWILNVNQGLHYFTFDLPLENRRAEGRLMRDPSNVSPLNTVGDLVNIGLMVEWRYLPFEPTTDFDFDMYLAGAFRVPNPNEITTIYGGL